MFFLILKTLFFFILILLALILFVPILYALEGIKQDDYFFSADICWLWKLLGIRVKKEENKRIETHLSLFGITIPVKSMKGSKRREKKKETSKLKRLKKRGTRFVTVFHRPFLRALLMLVRRLLWHILPKKYRIHLIYGCADPADTGILAGILSMVLTSIPNRDMIIIQPVFDDEIIQGEINIKGRIILAVIIYSFLRFYFARGIRQAIREIRKK